MENNTQLDSLFSNDPNDYRPAAKADPLDSIKFSGDSAYAYDLMENTSDHMFITGKAGTGKSTLVKVFLKNTKKKCAVIAPTGVAAVNIGGQTIHSFLKIKPGLIGKNNIRYNRRLAEMISKLDTIIIDEVSMVRSDFMDIIDAVLRISGGNPTEPFGGIQMILVGDLCQLPPVVPYGEERTYIDHKYGGNPYFFASEVIRECDNLRKIELRQVYRQSDDEFIGILNKIRIGNVSRQDLDYLNEKCVGGTKPKGIFVTSTNKLADIKNRRGLAMLDGDAKTYKCSISGKFNPKSTTAKEELLLKVGARVMMIHNDSEKRWINGSTGVITELHDKHVCVHIDGGEVHEVYPVAWDNKKYDIDYNSDNIASKVIGTFSQLPIRLGWACTIHKSQGSTFDEVNIDLGSGAFAHGQTYVAMSRCRTLEGMRFTRSIMVDDVIFDSKVTKYLTKFDNHNETY